MPLGTADLVGGASVLVAGFPMGGIYDTPAWDQGDALSVLMAPPDFTISGGLIIDITEDVEIVSAITADAAIASAGLAGTPFVVSALSYDVEVL